MNIRRIITQSIKNWWQFDPFTYGAAVAYCALFSFPAIIIFLIGIGDFILEKHAFEDIIFNYIQKYLNDDAFILIKEIIQKTKEDIVSENLIIVAIAILSFSAIKLFLQIQKTMDLIWRDKTDQRKWWKLITDRLIALLTLILGGGVLIFSLTLNLVITELDSFLQKYLDDFSIITDVILSYGITTITVICFFTLIIKVLPDYKVKIRSALFGGLFATVFFMLGEFVLRYYLQNFAPSSIYGAAGSIIIIMMWFSYSTMTLLLGTHIAKEFQNQIKE